MTSIIGVELFFVLSGFVLTPQLQKVEIDPKIFLKTFLLRRWYRTIPPYFFALICASIVFGYGNYFNFLKFATYTQNLFGDTPEKNFYPVAWSLSVEEWFYLLIPLLILLVSLFRKSSTNKLLYICLFVIFLLSFFRIIGILQAEDWGEDIRRSVIFRLDSLCWGVIAYLLIGKIKNFIILIILGLSVIIFIIIFLNLNNLNQSIFLQIIFFPNCSISFSALILLILKVNIKLKLFLECGKHLANLSYSMYLFHIFFILMFIDIFDNTIISLSLYLFSLFLFCYLFFKFYEKPILGLRPKYKN